MKIAIASDHAGYELKQVLAGFLRSAGHELDDLGTDGAGPVDYPAFGAKAASAVAVGKAERAVVVCGSGVGVCIAANKIDGIRAVNAHDSEEAEASRRHNDANVLCLAGRRLAPELAEKIVETFLSTEFEGGRHQRRLDQITELEAR